MEFCPKCDNVFTYKEDLEERTLQHFCTICDVYEPIKNNCLTTKTTKKIAEKHINFDKAVHDKTLPTRSNANCPECSAQSIVYIRNENLTVTSICKECNHKF